MLDLSGGDTAALADITTAQRAVVAQAHPDLIMMVRLAIHRDHLSERNSHTPTELPAIWVKAGRFNRAKSIAESITDLVDRTKALASVAEGVVDAGHLDQAGAIIDRAEETARSITTRTGKPGRW